MHYWGVWRNFIIRILCGETSSLECHPKLDVPLPQGQATRKPSLRQRNGVVKWRREMKRTSTSRLLNALSIICYTFHAPHSLSCNAFLWLSAMRKCSYAHEVTSVVWCQCMQPLSKGRMEEGGGEVDIYVFWFPCKLHLPWWFIFQVFRNCLFVWSVYFNHPSQDKSANYWYLI